MEKTTIRKSQLSFEIVKLRLEALELCLDGKKELVDGITYALDEIEKLLKDEQENENDCNDR
jgi:hypothetical protein